MRKVLFVAVLVGTASASAFAVTPSVPLATPPGITFQTTRTGVLYGDMEGKTLYTADAEQGGVSACISDCANVWSPAVAPANAKPMGDWTLATRTDGVKQWALKGKPLYTSAKDGKPGETKGTVEGWRAAVFQPPMPAGLPPDITVHEVAELPGQVLANAEGLTLYAGPLDCTAKCAETWMPVTAPAVAGTSGDFSAVKRKDGMRQWAYKGGALYTYSGDIDDGDMKGRGVDARFQAAALTQYFMPAGIAIHLNPDDLVHPAILTNAAGRALYAREHWAYTQTFHAKNGDRGPASTGREIGTNGCLGECLSQWIPVAAPADAIPSGHWSVMTRNDGSRQWAYMGYALYTFTGDKKPGDTHGNERFDLWETNVVGLPKVAGPTATASVMFWRVAAP